MSTKIAALQLQTLPMSEAKLDYYVRICAKNSISLIVLGEYVLNSFFKELENLPLLTIKEQSKHKLTVLKKLAKTYNVTIIAPIILCKKNGLCKATARVTPMATFFYEQNFLIDYKHWNEEKFFSNDSKNMQVPVFNHEGVRISIICGFDAHFDILWQQVQKRKADIVLVPSVSTFESFDRWNELLKTRAFLNNVYVLRINRIGDFKDKTCSWYFYGSSALYSPNGAIEAYLGDNEEMLICDIDLSIVKEAAKAWGFRRQLVKKRVF
ncbi:MAG: carbon-nitrogen hydrolase family protein [Campylobacteraceae bacterium]|jgi:nitrilase|nr:carbon-nitrogen hydrolase family protein [Campylobacteraceae bacterium]